MDYKTLYKEYYQEYFNYYSSWLLRFLKKNKRKGKTFESFRNRLSGTINRVCFVKYTVLSEGKFKKILKSFESNYGYEKGVQKVVFEEELKRDFKRLKYMRPDYKYEDFLRDIAKAMALEEFYHSFFYFEPLIVLMYKVEDFTEFSLTRYNKEPITSKRLYQNYYKKAHPRKNQSFKVKEKYIDKIENLYMHLTDGILNEEMTSFDDFTRVLFNAWDSHSSTMQFNCDSEEAAYLIEKLGLYFERLSFYSVGKSGLFKTKKDVTFSANYLTKSKGRQDEKDREGIDKIFEDCELFL